MRVASAQRSIADFHESTGDPEVFCGGGSVAAITAAGAAATALLVMRLDLNRRVNQALLPSITEAIGRTESMIHAFHALADADIASLDVLLQAQRALKSSADPTLAQARYVDALADAARSPLAIGDVALELLGLIDEETERAARFTISDLGAAAALLSGAFRAACLTAEVNIALLRDIQAAHDDRATEIDARRKDLLDEVTALAEHIEVKTRARIHRSRSAAP